MVSGFLLKVTIVLGPLSGMLRSHMKACSVLHRPVPALTRRHPSQAWSGAIQILAFMSPATGQCTPKGVHQESSVKLHLCNLPHTEHLSDERQETVDEQSAADSPLQDT